MACCRVNCTSTTKFLQGFLTSSVYRVSGPSRSLNIKTITAKKNPTGKHSTPSDYCFTSYQQAYSYPRHFLSTNVLTASFARTPGYHTALGVFNHHVQTLLYHTTTTLHNTATLPTTRLRNTAATSPTYKTTKYGYITRLPTH
jgi:hypothetical protein